MDPSQVTSGAELAWDTYLRDPRRDEFQQFAQRVGCLDFSLVYFFTGVSLISFFLFSFHVFIR